MRELQKIYLQKIGCLDASILSTLRKNLEKTYEEFALSFEIFQDELPLSEAEYNSKRRQYKSKLIFQKLINHLKYKKYFRTLGVMDKDVYSQDLNFVFGAAFMHTSIHKLAFISVTRLAESFYSRPENTELFKLRVLKEAIHELGHTFGLNHCNNLCVMRFSNNLLDTDRKPANYCEKCFVKLKSYLNTPY